MERECRYCGTVGGCSCDSGVIGVDWLTLVDECCYIDDCYEGVIRDLNSIDNVLESKRVEV